MALTKVDISMLEDITAGTKVVATAPSTSGNVLTSDGTNWTSAVAAGGGAWTHIETITPSAAATATFSHPSLSATYRDYAIYMSDIFAASNSKYFRMQIGTGSSVTWKTSGYYSSCDYRWTSNATYWREDANNANSYIIAGDSAGSSTAGCGMSGVLYLFDRTNDYVGWRSSFVNNWQSAYPGWCNAAGHAGQSNITNVRFLWESDVNFVANGYMALYGRVLP